MSINVTVHGNPISIKKGKMVTHEGDSEFDHRRKIRLQQVREQSKEIAADVRNRVKKEKERHLSKTEQKGEKDLKRWQARKLLALQQQYQDCLNEVGTAHTKAALEPDPKEVLNEQLVKNQAEASIREKHAKKKNREEITTKRLQLEKPLELKKQARLIEDERSAMITSLKPEKKINKRKKISTDIDISNKVVTDSDTSENEENRSSNIKRGKTKKKQKINIDLDLSSSDEHQISDSSGSTSSSSGNKKSNVLTPNVTKTSSEKEKKSDEYQISDSSGSTSSSSGNKKTSSEKEKKSAGTNKKSERKKSGETNTTSKKSGETNTTSKKNHKTDTIGKKYDQTDYQLQIQSNEIVDIPSKNSDPKRLPHVPLTSLRSDAGNRLSKQLNKVTHHDYKNHFSKKISTSPVVQRISKDSIEVHPPSERSESTEIKEVHTIRDKIALERGARAMERETMQRNYIQLMKELPVLQKQELLSHRRSHNPVFHMPADRLEELEKRRQSKIENIFEKYYHKSKLLETPIITIRPVQKSPPHDELKLPFKALDITQPNLQLNVGEWTTENVPQVIETEHQEQEQLADRQKALIDLLQRVNKQRELLLQEVSTLPPCSNLHRILKEDEILNMICPGRPVEIEETKQKNTKDKTSLRKCFPCESSPDSESDKNMKTKITKSSKKSKKPSTADTSTSTEATTNAKAKKKKKKQKNVKKRKSLNKHEETQTSPLLRSTVIPAASYTDSQEIIKPNLICTCNAAASSTYCKCNYDEVLLEPPKASTCKCDKECIKLSTCPCLETYKENLRKTGIAEKCPCIEKHKEDKLRPNKYLKSKQATVKNPYIERYGDVQKLCEIVIKASNQTDVQIHKDDEQPTSRRVILNVSKPTIISVNSPTCGNDQSSSSTYMSIPKNEQKQTKILSESHISRQQYKNLLHHKPQQTNMSPNTDPNRKEITPNLLKYIQKLLSMSRQSIDELTVSSISDVSTPGTSMVESRENNNPFVKLQNVMNYYNLSMNDIQMHLSPSDVSNASLEKERKVGFVQDNGPGTSKDHVDANTDVREQDACSSICIVPQNPKSPQSSPPARSPRRYDEVAEIAKETFGLKEDDMKEIPYANIVSKYKDLTKTCCERITKLTEMIDNVRLEKQRLLSPNASDRYETSVTSYLDLPKFTDSYRSNGSSSSSMSQDAVDRYLLAVETDPAKNISPTRKKKQRYPPSPKKSSPTNPVSVSARTTSPPDQTKEKKKKSSPRKNKDTDDEVPGTSNNEEPFVPMLQGIPKYSPPEDQAGNFINSPIKQFLLNAAKSKPPPALLRNATKFNIDMTPHELSTIAEMDTVASSKTASDVFLTRPRSPDDVIPSRDDFESSGSGFMTLTPDQKVCVPCGPKKSSLKQYSSSSSPLSPERPTSDADLSGIQQINSERSTSPEDMEVILRRMGLAWAIATLKKTHEALALSSSSSSVEASFRKRVSFKESSSSSTTSDVSLKDVLNKELIRKISHSTLKSNTSGSTNLQELQDLSEIRDPTIFNRDGSQHRTSTPVMNSKSTDSKKDLFTGDSDISSVRLHSEELFLSLPNMSLDTNKSLRKSK